MRVTYKILCACLCIALLASAPAPPKQHYAQVMEPYDPCTPRVLLTLVWFDNDEQDSELQLVVTQFDSCYKHDDTLAIHTNKLIGVIP
jgi:hypothetical protein